MKNFFKGIIPIVMCALMPLFSACSDDDDVKLYDVTVQLSYPETAEPYAGAPIELRNTVGSGVYQSTTDANGKAVFQVPAGVYEVTSADVHENDGYRYICNGTLAQFVVQDGVSASATIEMKVAKMNTESPIIIKEIYTGGCWNTSTNKAFIQDACIIIYNNSNEEVSLDNLAFGYSAYFNAEAAAFMGNLYNGDKLVYDGEGFIPAQNGIWYFPSTLTIPAYSQIVVNVYGAINNTLADGLAESVNYANSDYYCMYDPEYKTPDVTVASAVSYNSTSYYPSPADMIPTSHYLKTVKYGQANAWSFSTTSPAVFIFKPKDTDPVSYFENTENYWYIPTRAQTPVFRCAKVPNDWIIDGVEVWNAEKLDASKKRLTADIDAGHVNLTNNHGHVLYRNVDQASTEALPENEGKLIYNYSLGVGDSTDPSSINAEASMKNGAHIIFQDTNNSSVDFHERQKCSLRGE